MAFGMDYEKILRRHVLEEELRGGTDAVKDADLKLTAPPIKPQNKTNTTKLWWDAIMNDRSVAAAALVRQRNVDVDARDGCGRTALWHYAWRGDDTGLRHLLDLGADASVVDGDGDGPLAAVARRGEARCIECVEVLLRRGAPTDTRNDDGRTALWHASNYGRTKVVDALLRGGADANARGALRRPGRRVPDGAMRHLHARPEGAVNDICLLPTPRAVPVVAAVPVVDDARLRGVCGGRVVRGVVEDRETFPRRLSHASPVVRACSGKVHVPAAPGGRNVRHRIVQSRTSTWPSR